MRKEFNNIDDLIKKSNIPIHVSDDYDSKILMKLDAFKEKCYVREKYRIAGLSLIMSGLFMLLVFTSNLSYSIAYMHYKVKSNMSILEYKCNNSDIIKIITGEWF